MILGGIESLFVGMDPSPKLYSIACELQRTANIPRFAKNRRIIAHLKVPSTITFAQLHTAINKAFDFPETQVHDFRIHDANVRATNSESPNLRQTGGEAPCLLHISNQLTGDSTELDEATTLLSDVVEDPTYRSKYMEYVFGVGAFSRHSVVIQNHPNPVPGPQGIQSLNPENLEWHPLGREALMEMEEEEHCKQRRNPVSSRTYYRCLTDISTLILKLTLVVVINTERLYTEEKPLTADGM